MLVWQKLAFTIPPQPNAAWLKAGSGRSHLDLLSAATVAVRHNRDDLLWLVAGLGTVTFALFRLRVLH